ncbi:MAG: MFS transporter [Desulfobacteraceae bacterium]|nr:MFS transporter [Desulfobacteraceae bacterium]
MIPLSNSKNVEYELSYYGWIVVGMCFLANLVGFGLVYSYGVFFKSLASEFGWSRSIIAGAFSTYAILHNILAFFAGRLVDRYGPKLILVIAGFCLGLSMIVMKFVTSIFTLYFYFGIIFSIGIAFTYSPVMATVSRWFKTRRGLAVGLAAAGLGAGSLVFSPLSAWLISSFGWRQSYGILGIIAWVIFIPIVIFVREAPREFMQAESESESAKGLSFSEAFRTRTFWAFCFSWMSAAAALFAIMIHFVPLATDRGVSIVTAGILAGLIGAFSLIGRISAGFFSDKAGRKNIFISAFIFQLIITSWLPFAKEAWMLFIFAIIFGLSSGGWTGVIAAFPADYFGVRATGAIIGFGVIMAGVGVAIGPYLGGYFFDATQSYDLMVVMCIIATIAAIISALFLRPIKGVVREEIK